jgi:hypothetical protein
MTTTHNHAPVAQGELTDSEKDLISLAKLNEWRSKQYETLTQLRATSGYALDGSYVSQFNDSLDDMLDDFLGQNGVDSMSANYAEVRALFRDASIDKFTEDEWGNSPASRGKDPNDHKSQSDIFGERIAARLGQPEDPESDSEQEADSLSVEELRRKLNEAREGWATIAAKRQGRVLGKGSKDYDALRDNYYTSVQQMAIADLEEQLQEIENSAVDDEEKNTQKNAKVIGYLFDEQKKLRELTTEKLQKTNISKFINWFNKRHFATKVALGVGTGVVAGVGGAFIAGAAGAATIGAAVGAGASAATRFFRGLAMKEKDQRGMKTAEESLIDEDGDQLEIYGDDDNAQSVGDRIKVIADIYNHDFEEDTKLEQKKRRKAVYWGLGTVAAGTALGYGIHEAAERIGDWDLQWRHPFGDNNGNGTQHTSDHAPAQPTDTSPETPDQPSPQDTVPGGQLDQGGDHSNLVGDTNGNMNVVTIEAGHGYTHELMDFASANGQHLSPEQAYQLHLALVDHFGSDYINIDGAGGHDIYFDHGDARLTQPGLAHWQNGVPEFTQNWMNNHGLWAQAAA